MSIKTYLKLLTTLLVVASAALLYVTAGARGVSEPAPGSIDAAYAAMGIASLTGPPGSPTVARPADPVTPDSLIAAAAPTALDLSAFRIVDAVARPPAAPGTASPAAHRPARLRVEFELSDINRRQLSERALREQQRDWLLFAAVGEHVHAADRLRDVFFDYPVVRYGHMREVATFEFGATRARYIGEGRAIGLIPEGLAAAERRDALADIADRLRKDLGEPFDQLLVYEYALDERELSAALLLTGSVAWDALYSDEYGYVEQAIRTDTDLKDFLGRIDYVVLARPRAGGATASPALTLGGRKLRPGAYRGITHEHVATLYQAEAHIQRAKEDFDRWADRRLREYNNQLRYGYNVGSRERSKLQRQYDEEVAAEWRRRRLVDGSGFSLDPTFDLPGLSRSLRALARIEFGAAGAVLQTIMRTCPDLDPMTGLLLVYGTSELASSDRLERWDEALTELAASLIAPSKSAARSPVSTLRLPRELSETLRSPLFPQTAPQSAPRTTSPALSTQEADERVAGVYQLMAKLSATGDPRSALLECVLQRNQHQSARYDGPLQGTEVGMVLFYTDLLAKIWAIKHADADPGDVVEGFVNLYNQPLEPIYRAERRALPSARLWFGHNDRGFGLGTQRDDGSLLMARVATRIYAAGSNPINPGEEVQTSRLMGAPMKWWNDYYEEVARHEPEYQRLNEIMKWSLIIGWLNETAAGGPLGFLAEQGVRREFWFPDWARAQPGLRFAAWESVDFYERGHLGTKTETMPLLATRGPTTFDREELRGFSGGVSLAPRRIFSKRVQPVRKVPGSARRSFLDYARSNAGRSLSSLEKATYRFGDDGVSAAARAAEGVRRQGIAGELANGEVTRTFSTSPGRQAVNVSFDGSEIGVLVKQQQAGALRIGFRSRTIDRLQDMVRRASSGDGDLSGRLAAQADVSRVVEVSTPGGVRRFARLGRSREWAEVARDPADEITVAAGWTGRASEHGATHGLRYRVASESTLADSLTGMESLVFRRGAGGGVIARASGKTHAGGGKEIVIEVAEGSVPARVLPDGSVAIRTRELPAALRQRPERLAGLVPEETLVSARGGEGGVPVRVTRAVDGGEIPATTVQGGRRALALRAASDPSAVKQTLTAQYRAGLRRARRFLNDHRPNDALAEIDALERVLGETPDLAMWRGLAMLDAGKLQQATLAMSRAPRGPIRNPADFVDEVAARLGGSKPPEPPFGARPGAAGGSGGRPPDPPSAGWGAGRRGGSDRYMYERWLKAADARRRTAHGHRFQIAPGPGRHLEFRYQLADDALQRVEAVGPGEAKAAVTADGRVATDVYVQAGGPLGRLDWSQARLPDTLAQVVTGDLGRVVRLPIGDAAAYRPSRLYHRPTGQVFQRATTAAHTRPTLDWPALGRATRGDLIRASVRQAAGGGSGECAKSDAVPAQACPRPAGSGTRVAAPSEVLVVLEK